MSINEYIHIDQATMFNSIRPLRTIRLLSQYSKNKQIYLLPQENHLLASFSKSPNGIPVGTVAGFNGSSNTSIIDINPENFHENKAFLSILHKIIGKTVYNDFLFIMEAGVNANLYMPIYDFRRTPNYARIPEVDDIFGYVHVDGNGKMIPGTYEANNLYRLCNGESGIIQLSEYLHEQVKKACEV